MIIHCSCSYLRSFIPKLHKLYNAFLNEMALPRVLKVFVFANILGVVLSCGGGSPPPPCSWTVCRIEFRDDWAPPISQGLCVEQIRRAHHINNQHHGSGSCPAPQPCGFIQPQNRLFCKYDINYKSLFYGNLGPKTLVSYNAISRSWIVVRRSWFANA